MNRLLWGLVALDVALVTWFAFERMLTYDADSDASLALIKSVPPWVLVGVLTVFYTITIVFSIAIVRFLYRFSCKLAQPSGNFNAKIANQRSLLVMVVSQYCYTGAMVIRVMQSTESGVALLVIPAVLTLWMSLRDRTAPLSANILSGLPMYLYLLAETAVVLWD